MKTIYLIRHGQTLFNKQKKIQGWCDAPLTELGINQAKLAKQHIDQLKMKFDCAYSSTSERACDTLEIITSQNYTRVKGLKEWNFGSYEGEGEHLNPPLPYRDFFVQFGGEEELAFQKRIVNTITDLTKTSDGTNILMVSHGAAIAQFYKFWEDSSEVRRNGRIQNCSILKYNFENDKFVLQEIINHDFSSIE